MLGDINFYQINRVYLIKLDFVSRSAVNKQEMSLKKTKE